MITAQMTSSFNAYITVTASTTIEAEAGRPINADVVTLASDPWTSMYPG